MSSARVTGCMIKSCRKISIQHKELGLHYSVLKESDAGTTARTARKAFTREAGNHHFQSVKSPLLR